MAHHDGAIAAPNDDGDVAGLVQEIKSLQQRSTEEVMGLVSGAMARMTAQQAAQLADSRSAADAVVGALREHVVAAREELSRQTTRRKRAKEQLRRAAGAVAAARHVGEWHAAKRLAFNAWHGWVRWRMERKRLAARAARQLGVRRMQGLPLKRWSQWARASRRRKETARLPAAVIEARDAVWAEASATIDDLRVQLSAMKLAERQQAEAHERAKEEMRRAFMRTVCTMNIEAIGIMQNGVNKGSLPHPNSRQHEPEDSDNAAAEPAAALADPGHRPTFRPAPSIVSEQEPTPREMLTDGGMQNVLATWLPAAGLSARDEHNLLQQPGLLLRPSSPPRALPRDVSVRKRMQANGCAAPPEEQASTPWQPARWAYGPRQEDAAVSGTRWSPPCEPLVIDVRKQLRNSLPAPFVRMRLPGQRNAEVVPTLCQQCFSSPPLKDDSVVRTSAEKPAWRT